LKIAQKQVDILKVLDKDAPVEKWRDWRWQIKHCVRDLETFEKATGIELSEREKADFKLTVQKFPMSVTPYYLSLINTKDYWNDPVFRQAFPSPLEMDILKSDMADPLSEDKDSPVEGVTHRYPDRVLLLVSNVCSMYCRHCTRKRKVGDRDFIPEKSVIMKGIDYIRKNAQVRDVLLSGGDPFLLSDKQLDWILTELRKIKHVEIIRIGTRTPVVLPYRVTDSLIKMLKKHQPIWINTHFNHPHELTEIAGRVCTRLADAGIPLGNQTVLLRGVNDDPLVMRRLMQKLLIYRIRPYYIYQADAVQGTEHFRTRVEEGLAVIRALRGHTSGMAVPAFVIDAPGGGGKIPLLPDYLQSLGEEIILRNYQGDLYRYPNPELPVVEKRDLVVHAG